MQMIYELNQHINQYEYKVIYGAGRSGQQLLGELLQIGVSIDYFCDSNNEKIGTVILGKKVLSLDELKTIKDKTAVLIGKAYTFEIADKLTEEGFINIFLPFPEEGISLG